MRAQLKLCVLMMCILVAFGIESGTSDVFAQGSGGGAPSEIENLKKQMTQMEEQLRKLRQKVDKYQSNLRLRSLPFRPLSPRTIPSFSNH